MEFGCCTYRGAADFGFTIVDYDANPLRLRGVHERSEVEQANYLRDLLQVFDDEGVDSAFWFTFAGDEIPHRDDPAEDLDMGSFGLVKLIKESESLIYPRLPWEPKQAFRALADTDRGGTSRGLLIMQGGLGDNRQ